MRPFPFPANYFLPGSVLPYPSRNLDAEIALLVLFAVVEPTRLFVGEWWFLQSANHNDHFWAFSLLFVTAPSHLGVKEVSCPAGPTQWQLCTQLSSQRWLIDTPFIDIVQSGNLAGGFDFTKLTCFTDMSDLDQFSLPSFRRSIFFSFYFRLHSMLSQTIRVCAHWAFGKSVVPKPARIDPVVQ